MAGTRAGSRFFAVAVLMGAIASASGCSSTGGLGKWFGGDTAKSAKAGGVFYAAVEGLPVLDAPKAGARVVGTLKLHQKVTRSTVDSGYAKVKASSGGLEGWVLNAKLIWRLPAAEAPAPGDEAARAQPADGAAPAPGEADAATDAADEAAAEATAADAPPAAGTPPADAPAPRAPRSRGGASVFDPY